MPPKKRIYKCPQIKRDDQPCGRTSATAFCSVHKKSRQAQLHARMSAEKKPTPDVAPTAEPPMKTPELVIDSEPKPAKSTKANHKDLITRLALLCDEADTMTPHQRRLMKEKGGSVIARLHNEN